MMSIPEAVRKDDNADFMAAVDAASGFPGEAMNERARDVIQAAFHASVKDATSTYCDVWDAADLDYRSAVLRAKAARDAARASGSFVYRRAWQAAQRVYDEAIAGLSSEPLKKGEKP
jgi:hypothetical protein